MTVSATAVPLPDSLAPEKSHYDRARQRLVGVIADSAYIALWRKTVDPSRIGEIIASGEIAWYDAVTPFNAEDPVESTYFMRMEVGHSRCPIKIGYSNDPDRRAEDIRCSSPYPITVLVCYPSVFLQEALVHDLFTRERIRGEWFRPSKSLLAFIDVLRSLPNQPARSHRMQGPVPPVFPGKHLYAPGR